MNSSSFQVTDVTESRFHFLLRWCQSFSSCANGLVIPSVFGMESKKIPKRYPGHFQGTRYLHPQLKLIARLIYFRHFFPNH